MTEALISEREEIVSFIPQRDPIVMVDVLYTADIENIRITSGLTIEKDNIFCNDNYFSPAGIIEHIAQTAALMAGYMGSKQEPKGPPKVGFIGSVRNAKMLKPVICGEKLMTSLETLHRFDNVSIVKAVVKCNNEEVASAELQIFEVSE